VFKGLGSLFAGALVAVPSLDFIEERVQSYHVCTHPDGDRTVGLAHAPVELLLHLRSGLKNQGVLPHPLGFFLLRVNLGTFSPLKSLFKSYDHRLFILNPLGYTYACRTGVLPTYEAHTKANTRPWL
jgi:hypothetical protein